MGEPCCCGSHEQGVGDVKFRDSISVAKDQGSLWFASSVGRFLCARCQATGSVPTKGAVGERESPGQVLDASVLAVMPRSFKMENRTSQCSIEGQRRLCCSRHVFEEAPPASVDVSTAASWPRLPADVLPRFWGTISAEATASLLCPTPVLWDRMLREALRR